MNCSQVTINIISHSAVVTAEANRTAEITTQCVSEVRLSAAEVKQNVRVSAKQIETNPTFIVSKVCTLAEFISCIANGMWLNLQPWLNGERWKN